MRILIQGSLAAQQICFLGIRNAPADRGKQPHFSIWSSNQIGRDRNYLSGKERKKKIKEKTLTKTKQKKSQRKNQKMPQPKILKGYFVYFHSHWVKMEQEFRCLCCIYLFFWMTGFFRIRLRSWTSHCICCGCFIRNAGSICQPGSVLRLLLRDTRRQLIRRASEGQLIASSLSVPGNI